MPTMTAPTPTTTQAPTTPGMGRCQHCGNTRQTAHVAFHRNVGMLVIRRSYKLEGNFCKSCVRKSFGDFMVKNLTLGWWGTISLIITPVYAIQNVVSYTSAMRALSTVHE